LRHCSLDQDSPPHLDTAHQDADGSGARVEHRVRLSGRLAGVGETQARGFGVGIVVGARAEDEMIGIHAAPYVAAMADNHSAGNRTVLQRPGESVRRMSAALVAKAAIPIIVIVALPDVAAGQRLGLAVVGEAFGE